MEQKHSEITVQGGENVEIYRHATSLSPFGKTNLLCYSETFHAPITCVCDCYLNKFNNTLIHSKLHRYPFTFNTLSTTPTRTSKTTTKMTSTQSLLVLRYFSSTP
jgi:hypothetical protein